MNRDRLAHFLFPLSGFLFLSFCLWVLNHQLCRYDLNDVLTSLSAIGDRQLFLALGFTIIGYSVISTYDIVAFRCINYFLDSNKIILTSFITYAVSNTTGFTLLIGGGIRYRFYSRWGLPARKIVKVTAFGNLTFWLGLLSLNGIVFVANPLKPPDFLNLDLLVIRYLGIIFLILIGVYLYFGCTKKTFKIKNQTIFFPKPIITLCQIAVFSLDWALAAAVLYALLPNYFDSSYLSFFRIYLLSMTASMISNIPGGIGVFETIIIFLLPRTIATPDILGSLLAYRAIRFLLPLGVAISLVTYFEIRQKIRISKG